MRKKKTILVAGGAGLIGTFVCHALDRGGFSPVIVDNLSRGPLPPSLKEFPFFLCNKGDAAEMEKVFRRFTFQAVIDLAAKTDVEESMGNPLLYFENNLCETIRLLELLVKRKVPYYVFSSSAAVYGISQTEMLREDHPCHPVNPYGRSKWMIEQILSDLRNNGSLVSCSLRYFNAAGGDPEGTIRLPPRKELNLIPRILASLRKGNREATIYGTDYPTPDGTCVRDYIHVLDIAEAHVLALLALFSGTCSPVYNLGTGIGFSVREILTHMQQITEIPFAILDGPPRSGDPPRIVADAEKAKAELGWRPHRSLDQIIGDAWKN